MDNTKRLELTITALKESLAQKVVDYEGQIATIRADATMMLEESNTRIADLENQLAELRSTKEDVSEEE